MPARGDIVNEIGRELVANLDLLSKLESLEVGKTYVESKVNVSYKISLKFSIKRVKFSNTFISASTLLQCPAKLMARRSHLSELITSLKKSGILLVSALSSLRSTSRSLFTVGTLLSVFFFKIIED